MIFDPNAFKEKHVYTIYELYKSMERNLENKKELNSDETQELALIKTNISVIEEYAEKKRKEGIKWSLASLFQDAGMNPTLILEFYPGSDSYKAYGKNLVVNVEYTDEDLHHIVKSIREGAKRVTGQLKFKKVPEFIDGELNTGDIFGIQ